MVEIIRERNPVLEEELGRDFRPFEVVEGDFTYRGITPDGRMRILQRRQRKVRFISLDQNSICETVADLGKATGEDSYVMPCSDAVEMAEVIELIAWQKRKAAELVERRAWVQPLRDAAFIDALHLHNDEVVRRKTGASTFGPHVRIQRET